MWYDMEPTGYDRLNKFNSIFIPAVVDIVSRHGLTIGTHCTNQPNKSKANSTKPYVSWAETSQM